MEGKLAQIAMGLDVDVKVLQTIYGFGYSAGWDDANEMLTSEVNKPDYYDTFHTEKSRGQRE